MFKLFNNKNDKLKHRKFYGIICLYDCPYRRKDKCSLYDENVLYEYSVFRQEEVRRRCNDCINNIERK